MFNFCVAQNVIVLPPSLFYSAILAELLISAVGECWLHSFKIDVKTVHMSSSIEYDDNHKPEVGHWDGSVMSKMQRGPVSLVTQE